MKETKYQVFISSTYSDLSKYRKKVLEVLLMADCIPAGMESFVATDDEQFNVIKKVIDLCDYYILIIGKTYGSINPTTGISYTEMEYNYALDKGIPVLVFAIDDSTELENYTIQEDEIKHSKLIVFKERAMKNRLASIWRDSSELMSKVAISIMTAKNEIERPGWHRGKRQNIEELLLEIIHLRDENEELKKNLIALQTPSIPNDFDEIFYNKKIILNFTEEVLVFTSNTRIDKKRVEVTLSDLFAFISLRLDGVHNTDQFIKAIDRFVSGYYVNKQDALKAKNKLIRLGLFESFFEDNIEYIKLTKLGNTLMNELNPF
ncbi:MAG: DUF4062 domain-containing protein [Anaerotignum propionicum]|uniref:DUF4062 domain-containing protein n=1 Tax=Anaerotignum propionicum TaxID=28446 RepID=UPI002B21EE1A|nr:DUF4062 domain-containing protein [Anaerotignum propionicum]MEA5058270.1 DUF4062 domain-containing protein [Anaerotignum propionicum]